MDILELLAQQGEDHWLPWQQKRPLLHIACERGAWNCVKYLVSERSDEINQCYDENYPIHQATRHEQEHQQRLELCEQLHQLSYQGEKQEHHHEQVEQYPHESGEEVVVRHGGAHSTENF